MDTLRSFSILVLESKNGKVTNKENLITIEKPAWSSDGRQIALEVNAVFEEFALFFQLVGDS